ncbi:transglutaminase TgpA family protein [Gilvimarinus agarilyticus]|uniref:transglutaminase TgpA family protein n=1 Tax=Gilvimarinus agarilyticus TaxID=679259 RepID=UPI0005A0D40D|nr:DUF3488 and transglutaminase-like domain-containing protein [Gilvimarinus agarilyticus]
MSASTEKLSRQGLIWMLLAQAIVLLPLVFEVPVWLTLLAIATGVWRWKIATAGWRFPGKLARLILVLLVCAGLLFSFSGSFGMQSMLSLLIAGFVLKLIELKRPGDFYLLCYLAYFVTGAQLLFAASLPSSVYGLVSLLAVTGVLLVNNGSVARLGVVKQCQRLGVFALQALPIMLVLFFVVPRIGSLWTIPLNKSAGQTGVSDSMAPGDFSNLMRSGELAFRVSFDGPIPAPQQLYWRALVFDDFDGRTWRQSHAQDVQRGRASAQWRNWQNAVELSGEPISYQVLLEPTAKQWLYALPTFSELPESVRVSPGLTLYETERVNQRKQYRVSSVLDYRLQPQGLDQPQTMQALALPEGYNPQTRRRAQQWRTEATDERQLMQRVLGYFNQRFRYTLQPSTLGEHTVDDFLWQSQAGFCEHFAGSFVFFMRAAGIPARVVVGYQGGQINSNDGYLVVRQYDAHAWAEVWLAGEGWVRVDPTAAVAPERIEQGVEYSLSDDDNQLLGNVFSRRFQMLGDLQLRWDALNYRWQLWVMGYDNAAQQALLQKWFGRVSPWMLALVVTAVVALVSLVVLLPLLRSSGRRLAPAERAYARVEKAMTRCGQPRYVGEPPRQYAARISRERPDLADDLNAITALFERASYGDSKTALARLQSAARRFKPSRL